MGGVEGGGGHKTYTEGKKEREREGGRERGREREGERERKRESITGALGSSGRGQVCRHIHMDTHDHSKQNWNTSKGNSVE